jgi:uncharacterized membrane protein
MTHTNRTTAIYIALAVAGAIVALVLTSFHFSVGAEAKLCSTAAGCSAVNASRYSQAAGVPIAILGLGAYLVIGGIALLSRYREDVASWAPLAIFGISLIGVLYSAHLTYLEFYVIRAICPWCVASALIMTAIWVTSIVNIGRAQRSAAAAAQ